MPISSLQQQFQVPFSYTVHFTEGLFDSANHLLRDVLAQDGGEGARKVFFVVDSGVAEQHPQLAAAITHYAEVHSSVMQLSGPITVIPGGEQCKNDPELIQQLLTAVNTYHIDRHSYFVALGGGA